MHLEILWSLARLGSWFLSIGTVQFYLSQQNLCLFFLRGWGERWNSSLFGISIPCLIISISGV